MTALLTAEFRKVLGLRYWWILGIAPLVVGLFCGALTLPVMRQVEDILGPGFAEAAAAAVGISFALALVFLFAALFGVVDSGGEYQHRTIITTFLTTRGRDLVIASKYATAALFGLLYCVITEVVSALTILMFGGGFSGADLGSIAGVLGTGLLCAVLWALIGSGLGLFTGSMVGSVLAICAWVPFGELTVSLVLHGMGLGGVAQFLPAQITWYTLFGVVDVSGEAEMPVSWPLAPLVLIFWTALICGLGWWRTRSRDLT